MLPQNNALNSTGSEVEGYGKDGRTLVSAPGIQTDLKCCFTLHSQTGEDAKCLQPTLGTSSGEEV